VRFSVGDACSLDEPDDSFDAARSERTLQWLVDPAAAVAEMVRVLRPGGRVSLIDTDWSTFTIDVGDDSLAALVRDAMRPSAPAVQRRAALTTVACRVRSLASRATQIWTTWDPDESPAPDGCFSMESLADDLVARERLPIAERARFVSTIHDAARRGRFSMRLTMFAVVAAIP
jgi:SAM-dependent methyltransferase